MIVNPINIVEWNKIEVKQYENPSNHFEKYNEELLHVKEIKTIPKKF